MFVCEVAVILTIHRCVSVILDFRNQVDAVVAIFTFSYNSDFADTLLQGEGRDWVGEFLIRGRYEVEDGSCHWSKRYIGEHDVLYKGFNEGKGIWGTWELDVPQFSMKFDGGFHIWPEGMPDPTGEHLSEAADLPVLVELGSEIEDAVLVK